MEGNPWQYVDTTLDHVLLALLVVALIWLIFCIRRIGDAIRDKRTRDLFVNIFVGGLLLGFSAAAATLIRTQ